MIEYDKRDITVGELKETNAVHVEYRPFWDFLLAAYEGLRALLAWGVLKRHPRETEDNFNKRVEEAYGFGYSQSIVDLFAMYLFKRPGTRTLGDRISKDKQFNQFEADCNLFGDNFQDWLLEQQQFASALGHVGILVDKSPNQFSNKAQELAANVYPYVTRYLPQAILDWEWARDENNRPYLAFIKLLEDDDTYRLWWPEGWRTYHIPDDEELNEQGFSKASDGGLDTAQAVLDAEGENRLKANGQFIIPFVWLYNSKSRKRGIGTSDIKDVAYIDASIIRNLSQGEEIIELTAFPIMRMPRPEEGPNSQTGQQEVAVGPSGVLWFDKDAPEARPDWLESNADGPINCLLGWIAKKVEEIYRASNAGGMSSTEISTQAKSGAALTSEFQLLNGKLVSKGSNLEECERSILFFWLLYQQMEAEMENVTLERPRSYDVENLAQDLENMLTGKTLVMSTKFLVALQKNAVRLLLPGLSEDDLNEIDKELEDNAASGAITPFQDIVDKFSGGDKDDKDEKTGKTTGDNQPPGAKGTGGAGPEKTNLKEGQGSE